MALLILKLGLGPPTPCTPQPPPKPHLAPRRVDVDGRRARAHEVRRDVARRPRDFQQDERARATPSTPTTTTATTATATATATASAATAAEDEPRGQPELARPGADDFGVHAAVAHVVDF